MRFKFKKVFGGMLYIARVLCQREITADSYIAQ